MSPNEPLKSLAQYGRLHREPVGLLIFEFCVAALPMALYLAQSLDAPQAIALGCKCLVVFLITGLFRHGCGWSTRPTFLACVVLFLPALVWAYQHAMASSSPTPSPVGQEYGRALKGDLRRLRTTWTHATYSSARQFSRLFWRSFDAGEIDRKGMARWLGKAKSDIFDSKAYFKKIREGR